MVDLVLVYTTTAAAACMDSLSRVSGVLVLRAAVKRHVSYPAADGLTQARQKEGKGKEILTVRVVILPKVLKLQTLAKSEG